MLSQIRLEILWVRYYHILPMRTRRTFELNCILEGMGSWIILSPLNFRCISKWGLNFFFAICFNFTFADQGALDFENNVAPILLKRCIECHQGKAPSGKLSLTTLEGFKRGSQSGPVYDDENPSDSTIIGVITSGEMPPKKQGISQKLPQHEIEILKSWIESGASWPQGRTLDYFEKTNEIRAGRDWWSLQKIKRPSVPQLKSEPNQLQPVDAFILDALEKNNISSAPVAAPGTLIRRLYYALTGLPPEMEKMNTFTNEIPEDDWDLIVEELLSSPAFGERWGRYWLDLVRYADTNGYERDKEKKYAWKYRDWVISAFNSDMPYNQFIIEQLAGDEISGRNQNSTIATGFLRLGTWNDEPNDGADYQYERLEDLIHTTSSTFLALTVKCARCHSHKFDPIEQEDYYRMGAAFWPGPVYPGHNGDGMGGPSYSELGYENVLGWTDVRKEPPPLKVLKNGERNKPLEAVRPASISTIPFLEKEFHLSDESIKTSQLRLELANWIATPHNPLTARVMVNRIWQHLFGKAIVRTPNNFGFLADPPTHPELLDWLAMEFIENDWSIKHIIRLILKSRTWRQSSIHPNATQIMSVDANNRLWWKSERRRMDAESIRDSLLSVSNELNSAIGGEGFKATISREALEGWSRKSGDWQPSTMTSQMRRSVYMFIKRGLLTPIMTTFDQCDPTQSCGQRNVTTVPTQALALLNNQFVHDRSEFLARSIVLEESHIEDQIIEAWKKILKRKPTKEEFSQSLKHVSTQLKQFSLNIKPKKEAMGKVSPEALHSSLVFHLRADQARVIQSNDSDILSFRDLSKFGHEIRQVDHQAKPEIDRKGLNGKPALSFNGKDQFLNIDGMLIESSLSTFICVVSDKGTSGHREIISNWNGSAGNSTTSIFLGLTDEKTVRFSDAFPSAGSIERRTEPFILSAVNGVQSSDVYQNGQIIGSSSTIKNRRLDTEWVIGQQGNINGEFWNGSIAEIRVYSRPLSKEELSYIHSELSKYYGIALRHENEKKPYPPEVLALASLCHVLMNTNEFVYID